VLSTGGQGWQAAAAIDGTGNSVAVWDEIISLSQLWSRSKPSNQLLSGPATGTGNWSTPVTVSEPGNEIGPEAAAVSSSGSAIVVYSGYDANNVHTEYATNYRPFKKTPTFIDERRAICQCPRNSRTFLPTGNSAIQLVGRTIVFLSSAVVLSWERAPRSHRRAKPRRGSLDMPTIREVLCEGHRF
jgi:hypothetical protein